jgi:hypothetical protein
MKTTAVVRELEHVARQLGLRVRFEKGSFRGGRCTLTGEDQIVLNRMHPPEAHIALLAESLREMPVDSIFVKPVVRRALEEAWARRPLPEADIGDA